MQPATKTCRETRSIQTTRIFKQDLNPLHTLFGGKLVSLIDTNASIAVARLAHLNAATASIDSMNFLKPIVENQIVIIESFVSGTGNKSVEVYTKVISENLETGQQELAAICFMTFVIIPNNQNDIPVPKITPETAEEKAICQDYEKRKALQKEARSLQQRYQKFD